MAAVGEIYLAVSGENIWPPTGRTNWPLTEEERNRHIAELISRGADLVVTLRRERDRRLAAGDDVTWLTRTLSELEPLAEQLHSLETFQAIRAVTARHGSGPYPVEELATIAGIDVDEVRRELAQMMAEGLATPAEEHPNS